MAWEHTVLHGLKLQGAAWHYKYRAQAGLICKVLRVMGHQEGQPLSSTTCNFCLALPAFCVHLLQARLLGVYAYPQVLGCAVVQPPLHAELQPLSYAMVRPAVRGPVQHKFS